MKIFVMLAATAIAAGSLAQGYRQPWERWAPWESVVDNCQVGKQVPFARIALDDFVWQASPAPIAQINWWGVVSDPKQLTRRYYVAIYRNIDSACLPEWQQPVYKQCFVPTVERVGIDCKNNVVYKFTNFLPAGFFLPAGRYWLQVSEDDAASYKPGAIDFWWSAYQPVQNCPAFQRDFPGTIFRPLIDPCNQKPDDLAFEIL